MSRLRLFWVLLISGGGHALCYPMVGGPDVDRLIDGGKKTRQARYSFRASSGDVIANLREAELLQRVLRSQPNPEARLGVHLFWRDLNSPGGHVPIALMRNDRSEVERSSLRENYRREHAASQAGMRRVWGAGGSEHDKDSINNSADLLAGLLTAVPTKGLSLLPAATRLINSEHSAFRTRRDGAEFYSIETMKAHEELQMIARLLAEAKKAPPGSMFGDLLDDAVAGTPLSGLSEIIADKTICKRYPQHCLEESINAKLDQVLDKIDGNNIAVQIVDSLAEVRDQQQFSLIDPKMYEELRGSSDLLNAKLPDRELIDRNLEFGGRSLNILYAAGELLYGKDSEQAKVLRKSKMTFDATVDVYKSVKKLTKAAAMFDLNDPESVLSFLEGSTTTAGLIKLGLGVFADSPTMEQILQAQIETVRKDIENLREEMHERFDRLEQQVEAGFRELSDKLIAIESVLERVAYISGQIDVKVNQLLKNHLEARQKYGKDRIEAIWQCVGSTGPDATDSDYVDCLPKFLESLSFDNPDVVDGILYPTMWQEIGSLPWILAGQSNELDLIFRASLGRHVSGYERAMVFYQALLKSNQGRYRADVPQIMPNPRVLTQVFSRFYQSLGLKLAKLKRKYPTRLVTEADVAAAISGSDPNFSPQTFFVSYYQVIKDFAVGLLSGYDSVRSDLRQVKEVYIGQTIKLTREWLTSTKDLLSKEANELLLVSQFSWAPSSRNSGMPVPSSEQTLYSFDELNRFAGNPALVVEARTPTAFNNERVFVSVCGQNHSGEEVDFDSLPFKLRNQLRVLGSAARVCVRYQPLHRGRMFVLFHHQDHHNPNYCDYRAGVRLGDDGGVSVESWVEAAKGIAGPLRHDRMLSVVLKRSIVEIGSGSFEIQLQDHQGVLLSSYRTVLEEQTLSVTRDIVAVHYDEIKAPRARDRSPGVYNVNRVDTWGAEVISCNPPNEWIAFYRARTPLLVNPGSMSVEPGWENAVRYRVNQVFSLIGQRGDDGYSGLDILGGRVAADEIYYWGPSGQRVNGVRSVANALNLIEASNFAFPRESAFVPELVELKRRLEQLHAQWINMDEPRKGALNAYQQKLEGIEMIEESLGKVESQWASFEAQRVSLAEIARSDANSIFASLWSEELKRTEDELALRNVLVALLDLLSGEQ